MFPHHFSKKITVFLLAAGLVSIGLLAVLPAQTPDKAQALLMAMAANSKRMLEYQWKQKTTVVRKANPLEPTIEQIHFDATGQMQRVTLSKPEEKHMRGLRARKAADVKDTIQDVMQLAGRYTNPEQLKRTIEKAEIWEGQGASAGTTRVQSKYLIQPGDEMMMLVNSATRLPNRIEFKCAYDGGPVTITVDYQPLPNGPSLMGRMVVSAPKEDLVVKVESFDFMRTSSEPLLQAVNRPNTLQTTMPKDQGWPRQYGNETSQVVVYQPQIDEWAEFKKMRGRCAIALTPTKGAQPIYGTFRFETETLVDVENRTVLCRNFQISDLRYPASANEPASEKWPELTKQLLPKSSLVVSLDRVLAFMKAEQVRRREVRVLLAPPPILVNMQPAVLVMIDGAPILLDIEKTNLQKVINTNWDLFLDKNGQVYYLRYDKSWLKAKDLSGTYSPASKLPPDFGMLPNDENYTEVRQTLTSPLKQPAVVPLVLVANEPAELIVIKGEPSFRPIAGTKLMWVENTESDLFFHQGDRRYYFLASGRWFRSTNLKGNWEGATTQLPEDFKKIPPHHPRSHVLAAVPGTQEAEDAVLIASIPLTAEVNREEVEAEVQYVGTPKFEPIPGTKISYAKNTPNDVLKVGDLYYLCFQGVWFVSRTPNGSWEAADKVPQEVYTIPESSPKYNLTYVQVYDSTPSTIVYGYMPGYYGAYISSGVVVWGTGYYYPPYVAVGVYPYPVYWPSPYYTYGASVWYNPATGGYARGAAVYGPYGGYGRAAAYNPKTGNYSWGSAAWGPSGAVAAGHTYNPTTGTWSAGYKAANPYQSWGQNVVGNSNNWARTAHASTSSGTVAGVQTSKGGEGVGISTAKGQGFVGKTGEGDLYAGANGNVYKRDSGQWYQNQNGSWNAVNKDNLPAEQQTKLNEAQSKVTARKPDATGPGGPPTRAEVGTTANVPGGLDREAMARERGNWNSERFESLRSNASSKPSGRGFESRPRLGAGRRR